MTNHPALGFSHLWKPPRCKPSQLQDADLRCPDAVQQSMDQRSHCRAQGRAVGGGGAIVGDDLRKNKP